MLYSSLVSIRLRVPEKTETFPFPFSLIAIMKDSQIGSYGTIALVLSMLLRWYCLTHLLGFGWIAWPMVVTAVASRAAVVVVMQALPNAPLSTRQSKAPPLM